MVCFQSFAKFSINVVSGIQRISEEEKSATIDGSHKLPAEVPRELTKLRTSEFISTAIEPQRELLVGSIGWEGICRLEDEHRSLVGAARAEGPLKQALAQAAAGFDFSEAWVPCGSRFRVCGASAGP